MPGQLIFLFGVTPALRRETFIVAPCNAQAFAFIESWPDWGARAAALYGPKGCGKTHLAQIWREVSGAAQFELGHEPDFAAFRRMAASLPGDAAILLEDAGAIASMERDLFLMEIFERPLARLLLTGVEAPARWPVLIADLRSRLDSLLAFPIWAPDDTLLAGIVRKHFADRQLSVPDTAIARILTHVERTPAAIAAFIARADSKALSEKRPISVRLVMDLVENS
jgi:chromosomal replication initiation ATPase DnaA